MVLKLSSTVDPREYSLWVEKDSLVYAGSVACAAFSDHGVWAVNQTMANHLLAELGQKAFDK
jgi:hypothetical protein